MIKTSINKHIILLSALACLPLHGCHKQSSKEKQIATIKNSIDSLQNIDNVYSTQVVYYSEELQNYKKKNLQYDNIGLLADNLEYLRSDLEDERDSVEKNIQLLAEPFNYKPSIKRWILRKCGIPMRTPTLTTSEYIALLKDKESLIEDKKTYNRLLRNYAYLQHTDTMLNNMIFELNPYIYEAPTTNTFSNDGTLINSQNISQNKILLNTANRLQNIKKQAISKKVNRQISKNQNIIDMLSQYNAIEDSLVQYQNKQQDIRAKIQYQQQLLQQKAK